jgi:phosphoadenosine phosphosulfate reductase
MTQCLVPPQSGQDLDFGQHLDVAALNLRFAQAHPREILSWCIQHIPRGLVQVSAFSVSGMVIMHLLYQELKPSPPVPVLFLDTLHHFPETLNLVDQAVERYGVDLRTYKTPGVNSSQDFAARYGEALWEQDEDRFYALTKIEPLERGLRELGAIAWINGRRRDQSSERANIPIFEFDHHQRLKINPLATWTNQQVWAYTIQHKIIYNSLYDQGYASIGEQVTTTPVQQGEDERAGRWRGKSRVECGIHPCAMI